nr:uncharacterized protein LOC111510944 [Leptinotarsa decemlineata]
MTDETTDLPVNKQLPICIGQTNTKDCKIEEDFIKFEEVVDLSGENLAHIILEELGKIGLDSDNCQAFDGSSNMSGIFKGVQARISQTQPLEIHSHCSNHRLNLAISKACSVTSKFFPDSAARFKLLEECGKIMPSSQKTV